MRPPDKDPRNPGVAKVSETFDFPRIMVKKFMLLQRNILPECRVRKPGQKPTDFSISNIFVSTANN